jgi:hypothetical protein
MYCCPGGVAQRSSRPPTKQKKDPGFESRQGITFLGIYTLQRSCQILKCIDIVYTWENKTAQRIHTIPKCITQYVGENSPNLVTLGMSH